MTEPDISISQKFKNFFKMVNSSKQVEQSIEPTPAQQQEKLKQETVLKIQSILDQCIQDHDAEKIEIILSKNFTMTAKQFFKLSNNAADTYEKFDSKVINSVLYASHHNEVKYELAEQLMECLKARVPMLKSDKFIRQAKMKEFNDTLNEYAIDFDDFDTIKNNIRTSLRENVKKLDSCELSQVLEEYMNISPCYREA